jgi:hypothetical protein
LSFKFFICTRERFYTCDGIDHSVLPNGNAVEVAQYKLGVVEHTLIVVAEHKPGAIDNMGHVLHNQLVVITVLTRVFSFLFT